MKRKGILMAGGGGSRLFPATRAISKHLLIVYDKPLIYYPLAVLMLCGLRDILIIGSARDIPAYKALFGTGETLGIRLSYAVQSAPRGIGEGVLLAEEFLAGAPSMLILGDNMFFGTGIGPYIAHIAGQAEGPVIFSYPVADPQRFCVIERDTNGRPVRLLEKPEKPPSNLAVPGLYVYDPDVVEIARRQSPGPRGELEITSINQAYLEQGRLRVVPLGRGTAWFDAGTPDALLEAANFVAAVQRRQGLMIACVEEIAWRQGWIDGDQLRRLSHRDGNTTYSSYLQSLADGTFHH